MYKSKSKIIVVMLVTIAFMSLGYALLSTSLNITGSTTVTSTWQVEFSDIRTTNRVGGATNKITPTYSATTASFEVDLVLPGDEITYEIDVTNYGDIDAEIQGASYEISGSDAIYINVSGVEKGTIIPNCYGFETCPKATIILKIGYRTSTVEQPAEKTKNIDFTLKIGQYVSTNPTEPGELFPNEEDNTGPIGNILMGYEVYPKENTVISNNKMTISNIDKYGTISGVLVEFYTAIPTSYVGNISNSSGDTIKTNGTFVKDSMRTYFEIIKGQYNSLIIDFGDSSIAESIKTVRVLKEENTTSIWTNKDISVYVSANDSDSGINGYSFDDGETYSQINVKTFSSNSSGTATVKDNAGNTSLYNYTINKIDKEPPTIGLNNISFNKINSGYYIDNLSVDYGDSSGNIPELEYAKLNYMTLPNENDFVTVTDASIGTMYAFSYASDDIYDVYFRVVDPAGNRSKTLNYTTQLGTLNYNIPYFDAIEITSNNTYSYSTKIAKCSDSTCNNIGNVYELSSGIQGAKLHYISEIGGSGFYKAYFENKSINNAGFELPGDILYLHNFTSSNEHYRYISLPISSHYTIKNKLKDPNTLEYTASISNSVLELGASGSYFTFENDSYCNYGEYDAFNGYCKYNEGTGYNNYSCYKNGNTGELRWVYTGNESNVICPDGTSKVYTCGESIAGQSCGMEGATTQVSCTGWCTSSPSLYEYYYYQYTVGVVLE